MAARTGTPTTSARRRPGSGTGRAPGRRSGRRPGWPARRWRWPRESPPGPGACAARAARPGRPAARRSRRNRSPRRRRPRRAPPGSPGPPATPAPAAGPGRRGLARQRHRRDQLEVVAALGHQPGLQPARGAQRSDPDVRDPARSAHRRRPSPARHGRRSAAGEHRPTTRHRRGVAPGPPVDSLTVSFTRTLTFQYAARGRRMAGRARRWPVYRCPIHDAFPPAPAAVDGSAVAAVAVRRAACRPAVPACRLRRLRWPRRSRSASRRVGEYGSGSGSRRSRFTLSSRPARSAATASGS